MPSLTPTLSLGIPIPSLDASPAFNAADTSGARTGVRSAERAVKRARSEIQKFNDRWRTRKHLDRLERSPRAQNETFRFAVIGDAEPGRFWFQRLFFGQKGVFTRHMKRVRDRPVDFTIQLGDMVSRAKARNFRAFFNQIRAAGYEKPFLTVAGNHDRHAPHGKTNAVMYNAIFGRRNYWFDRGGARFIILDTSDARLTARQIAWLDRILATDKKTLIFTHMAPITPRTLAATHSLLKHGGFSNGAQAFLDVLRSRGADRVYFGHIHGFGSLTIDGTRFVLSGGGGSPLYPSPWIERTYHFLEVSVGPDGIQDNVYPLDAPPFPID